MTKLPKILRWCATMTGGAFLLQVGGCDFTPFLLVLDTIFLGMAAAASYVIIRNV